jgi:CdiI immunity protein
MRTPALKLLLGAYFHQDWFDEFADEDDAVDAFVQGEPHLSGQLQAEIDDLLGSMDEAHLAVYLDSIGCEYLPSEEAGYRGWIGQIAQHLRAATAS